MTEPIVYSDLDHNLVADAQGALKKVVNTFALSTSVDNILRTRKGERCMLPQFGARLSELVFDNITPEFLRNVAKALKDEIEVWDDRIRVLNMNFYPKPDQSQVDVQVVFAIKGKPDVFTMSTNLI